MKDEEGLKDGFLKEQEETNKVMEQLRKENAELRKRNAELKGNYAHSARESATYKQFLELKEKENAELKSEKGCETCTKFDEVKLTNAKEIIEKLLKTPRTIWKRDEDGEVCPYVNTDYSEIVKQAKQFMKEIENE